MGVVGGGGGVLCDLRIDHVVHAILGTPTLNGKSSPSRTRASVRQPLIAFCEVRERNIDTMLTLRPLCTRGLHAQCALSHQELHACAQVLHADVLLPLLDTVAILKSHWEAMVAKVGGIVFQIAKLRKNYHVCAAHLDNLLTTLHEVFELLRQYVHLLTSPRW